MKHTECKDCKLRNGDCGHRFKMNGKTNYDIPSLTACDRYGDCEFFQQKEKPQGDLISRSALKEEMKIANAEAIDYETVVDMYEKLVDNAPTVTLDKIQAIMSDYLVYRCEPQRPQGEWIPKHLWDNTHIWVCSECGNRNTHGITVEKACWKCGADMRSGKEK